MQITKESSSVLSTYSKTASFIDEPRKCVAPFVIFKFKVEDVQMLAIQSNKMLFFPNG